MDTTSLHLDLADLTAGLDAVRESPRDQGRVELVIRRPATEQRELLSEAHLDPVLGLIGDNWQDRDSGLSRQLTLMNARAAQLIAGTRERWPLAGDQVYVDLHLGPENLPPGTRLAIGDAVIEVSDEPHRGCKKFMARFGLDALKFVNSEVGYSLNLRGINTRIIQAGTVRPGDLIRKLEQA
jgi:hypothetical protein